MTAGMTRAGSRSRERRSARTAGVGRIPPRKGGRRVCWRWLRIPQKNTGTARLRARNADHRHADHNRCVSYDSETRYAATSSTNHTTVGGLWVRSKPRAAPTPHLRSVSSNLCEIRTDRHRAETLALMKLSAIAAVSTSRIAAAAPLGFLIGVSLGALGGGGSILAVPALVYGAGEGAKAATTTSLLVVGTTALVGMVGHYRAGRVRLLAGAGFGLLGIGGSFVGSLLNRAVPGDALLLAFAVLILFAAWRMHAKQAETPCHAKRVGDVASPEDPPVAAAGVVPQAQQVEEETSPSVAGGVPDSVPGGGHRAVGRVADAKRSQTRADTVVRVILAGTVVGFLTGFFGVGGGFVIVPALVLALGYDMPIAIGTSLLVIGVSSAEGLAFRLSSGSIDWRIAIPFTIAAVIGVLLGDRVAGRVSAERLTKWFVWLLVAVAAYTGGQSLVAL